MSGEEFSPRLESRADLIDAMAAGAKPEADWRIGTEHEKHVFYRNPLRPVPYPGPAGIRALLDAIEARTGWAPLDDRGLSIGLLDPKRPGGISLEPGGQFELSGAPLRSIHETADELDQHMKLAKDIAGPLGINFLGLGVTPLWSVAEIPAMPKSRYAIMTPYMDRVGTLGTSMMYRSATVQANLDFSSEADMVQKLRVSLALQPVVAAIFANSPFVDGRPSGYLSFRSHIWLNTDRARTGMLPQAFEPGFGFERYADHALDVPMYFVVRSDRYIDVAGESFRDFLAGRLPQLPGERPTIKDWENHLSTLFPEVRLKQFLEMRGADMGGRDHVLALSALWAGLLYDRIALDAATQMVQDWTAEERQALRDAVPRTALNTMFRGEPLAAIARTVVTLAEAGLRRRAIVHNGHDEAIYLAPTRKIVDAGRTLAEVWLERYETVWRGDLTRIFDEAVM
jgi:glutamate--cysteine ligase